jgi:hypothetical protein
MCGRTKGRLMAIERDIYRTLILIAIWRGETRVLEHHTIIIINLHHHHHYLIEIGNAPIHPLDISLI